MKRYVIASTVKDQKIPTADRVRICMEFINYQGEVNESIEIAVFRNLNWAKPVIKQLASDIRSDKGIRYRIDFSDGRKAYITADGDNQFANSL